jgi:hypothetical protein
LKEHHKISNIPKFRCKMLWNADNIALRSLQFSVILDYKREISQGYIIRILQHFGTKLWNITNFVMLFHAMMEFCLDLLRSKFWLIGEWSIAAWSFFMCSVLLVERLQNSLYPVVVYIIFRPQLHDTVFASERVEGHY